MIRNTYHQPRSRKKESISPASEKVVWQCDEIMDFGGRGKLSVSGFVYIQAYEGTRGKIRAVEVVTLLLAL
jgi:hypothetical protein